MSWAMLRKWSPFDVTDVTMTNSWRAPPFPWALQLRIHLCTYSCLFQQDSDWRLLIGHWSDADYITQNQSIPMALPLALFF